MKYFIIAILSAVLLLSLGMAADEPQIKDEIDRINYSLGFQIGGDFKRQNVEIRPNLVVKGIQDALSGSGSLLSSEEMNTILVDLKKKIVSDQQKELQQAAEENLAKGKAFLEKNATNEGIVVRPSGLQYQVLREGTGPTPGPADTVEVQYRGTLIDGTEFDSSYSRGKPLTFQANRVIRGWAEALQLMKAGAKWTIFIPPDLAYGNRQTGKIEPNSTLIFEVELLSVGSSAK